MKWYDNWIQVFKSGTHTDSGGNTRSWSNEDLDKIIENFQEEVPVVLGHPKTDEPAYAWVSELKREGDILFAKFDKVHPEFATWVQKGLYRKISIALGEDLNLRHIGFLGAVAPAVKGLVNNFCHCFALGFTSDNYAPVELAAQSLTSQTSSSPNAKAHCFALGFTSDNYNKGDKNMFKKQTPAEFSAKIDELERELEFAKKVNQDKDFDALLDSLQKESKITAEDKDNLSEVLKVLYSGCLGQFSGENETVKSLVAFLKSLPKRCEFSELATNQNSPKGTYRTHSEELGMKIAKSLRG